MNQDRTKCNSVTLTCLIIIEKIQTDCNHLIPISLSNLYINSYKTPTFLTKQRQVHRLHLLIKENIPFPTTILPNVAFLQANEKTICKSRLVRCGVLYLRLSWMRKHKLKLYGGKLTNCMELLFIFEVFSMASVLNVWIASSLKMVANNLIEIRLKE